MATASISTRLCSSEERTNGFKLMRLIIDGGTEALRNVFKTKHPGDLQTVLGTYHSILQSLKARNIITPPQWVKLYPPGHMNPNIKEFDITLLFLLLRNICGMSAPIGTGWNNMPSNTDISLEANITRIKLFRNEFFGHIPDTSVSTIEFEARWKEVSTPLVNLGISQIEIDRLKNEECGQEEVDRIRREWRQNDTKVGLELLELKKMRTEDHELLRDIQSGVKSMKPDKHEILNKHLNWCDFSRDIELFYQKWCKETREWVFDQVSEWFNDTTSDSRAFIVTGQPGMGKSVIAAVTCKRFAKQLAACHFCQYNNDRYNNPKILLQSLARQLSNVLPEYKRALIEKLSGNEEQKLNDMSIQGLFSLLFKEPLTGIYVAKRYLIVIDAVDESKNEGKCDFVDLIADYLGQLPSFIRFLITSRPENHINKKFKKLNPMFLSPNDEQNVKDIQLLFEEKLSHSHEAQQISRLVEKCEGLMLFANYLYEILDDGSLNLDIDNLPTGIEGIYKSYFKRWENEFQVAEVRENDFLSFLSVITVSREPLPETLIARVFDSENSSPAIAKRKMHKIKNCFSLLLVFKQDRLTFFHKSVKDWLVECDHEFTVDEKFGHKLLANICAKEMDELKKKEIKPPFHSAAEYALLYGIQHKLVGTQGELTKFFVDRYVTDLEIMYASINVDVYATLNNIGSLKKDIIYSSVPEETRRTVETLLLLIKKYSNTFQDFPQSFLQHVLNWGGEELSLKAASLLNYRYRDLVYFEHMKENSLEKALVGRIYTSADISGIDISHSEDYLVCSYEDGEIELFSVEDMKSIWTIENVDLTQPQHFYSEWMFRSIVFHPLKNVILPGRLDSVITLQGKFELGPFSCNDINCLFENCCFSNDNSKMVTTYKNDLTVWSLVNNEKLQSFSSDYDLLSVSFSANGRFLATSDAGKEVVVYDFERGYISTSKLFHEAICFVSTFESDSWYCYTGHSATDFDYLCTVRHDLSALDPVCRDYYSRPLNVRAAAEFEGFFDNSCFLENFSGEPVENAWFRSLSLQVIFFCLDHGITLVSEKYSRELNFYRISKLEESLEVKDYHDVSEDTNIDISVDGTLIYTAGPANLRLYKLDSNCSFHLSLNIKWSYIPFVPVTNGVFFCRKLGDGRDCFSSYRCQIDIPELWNSDLTQRLDSFPELSGTEKCLSVTEEIVACIMTDQVCFFNVVERKIICKTCIPLDMEVTACSSKYHVLAVNRRYYSLGDITPSLWQDGEVVAEWANINRILASVVSKYYFCLETSIFSPSSEKLALSIRDDKAVYIFDVALARLLHKVDFEFLSHIFTSFDEKILRFLDEDHLLCKAYKSAMCIINASNGNALSCVNIGDEPKSSCVSRKSVNGSVLLCVRSSRGIIDLIKVWLPR